MMTRLKSEYKGNVKVAMLILHQMIRQGGMFILSKSEIIEKAKITLYSPSRHLYHAAGLTDLSERKINALLSEEIKCLTSFNILQKPNARAYMLSEAGREHLVSMVAHGALCLEKPPTLKLRSYIRKAPVKFGSQKAGADYELPMNVHRVFLYMNQDTATDKWNGCATLRVGENSVEFLELDVFNEYAIRSRFINGVSMFVAYAAQLCLDTLKHNIEIRVPIHEIAEYEKYGFKTVALISKNHYEKIALMLADAEVVYRISDQSLLERVANPKNMDDENQFRVRDRSEYLTGDDISSIRELLRVKISASETELEAETHTQILEKLGGLHRLILQLQEENEIKRASLGVDSTKGENNGKL